MPLGFFCESATYGAIANVSCMDEQIPMSEANRDSPKDAPAEVCRGFLLKEEKMNYITAQEKNQRVVTFLNREEVDFLDKLGKDALFSTGTKLSRTKLIAWLIDFMERLRINGKGIKSKSDFENRILTGVSSHQPRSVTGGEK